MYCFIIALQDLYFLQTRCTVPSTLGLDISTMPRLPAVLPFRTSWRRRWIRPHRLQRRCRMVWRVVVGLVIGRVFLGIYGPFDVSIYKSTFNWLAGCFGLSKSGWGLLTILEISRICLLGIGYSAFTCPMMLPFKLVIRSLGTSLWLRFFENCKVCKEVRWSPFYKLTAGTPAKIGDLYMFFPFQRGFPMWVFFSGRTWIIPPEIGRIWQNRKVFSCHEIICVAILSSTPIFRNTTTCQSFLSPFFSKNNPGLD